MLRGQCNVILVLDVTSFELLLRLVLVLVILILVLVRSLLGSPLHSLVSSIVIVP